MNEKKLQQLFGLARRDAAPLPPPEFAADVLRAARREALGRPAEAPTIWDALSAWFPRLALAAAAVIILAAAADVTLTTAGWPGLDDGAAQVSAQYLFDPEGV